MDFVSRIVCLLVGYVCGCMLTANLVSRRFAHKPVFELGDGNPGMANVGHCLGFRAAVYTLAGDILKVVVAAVISIVLYPGLGNIAMAWAGLGATIGHNYPFWHDFRGGKGVTTTCSAIILGSPVWGGLASILGFVAVVASEYLCVGAVAIPAFFLLFMLIGGNPDLIAVATVLLLLMIPQHWPAIRDISLGRTPKAGIAKKVREKLSGHRSQATDLDRTALWTMPRNLQAVDTRTDTGMPTAHTARTTAAPRTSQQYRTWSQQHEWRNASILDRILPLFEEDEEGNETGWQTPFASHPIRGQADARLYEQSRTRHATQTEAATDIRPIRSTPNKSPRANTGGENPSAEAALDKPKVIAPGSTAQMVIPKVSAPWDETNPLQQALLQAREHQRERRAAAIAEAERQRAEEQERLKKHPVAHKRTGPSGIGQRMQFGN